MDPYEVAKSGCALNLKDDLLVLFCSVLLEQLGRDRIYFCNLIKKTVVPGLSSLKMSS